MFVHLNRLMAATLTAFALSLSIAQAESTGPTIHLTDQNEVGKPPREMRGADAGLLAKCDTPAMPDVMTLSREIDSVRALFAKAPLLMPKIGCAALRMGPGASRHAVHIFTPGPSDDAYLRISTNTGGFLAPTLEMPTRFFWGRNPWMELPIPAHPREAVATDFTAPLQPLEPGRSIEFAAISRAGEQWPRRVLIIETAFPVQRDGAPVDRLVVAVETTVNQEKPLRLWSLWSDMAGAVVARGIAHSKGNGRAIAVEQDRLASLFLVAKGQVQAHYKADDLAPVAEYIANLASD